jgi:hypothetical protein
MLVHGLDARFTEDPARASEHIHCVTGANPAGLDHHHNGAHVSTDVWIQSPRWRQDLHHPRLGLGSRQSAPAAPVDANSRSPS